MLFVIARYGTPLPYNRVFALAQRGYVGVLLQLLTDSLEQNT